jgi:glutathione peroxidase
MIPTRTAPQIRSDGGTLGGWPTNSSEADTSSRIIGFPSNDFGNQEPGTHDEIADFCRINFGVTFPMMEKVHTKGPKQAPIYRTLTAETPEDIRGEIAWNFTKFLVNGDGEVVARFEPGVDPMDESIISAVEGLLPAEG